MLGKVAHEHGDRAECCLRGGQIRWSVTNLDGEERRSPGWYIYVICPQEEYSCTIGPVIACPFCGEACTGK